VCDVGQFVVDMHDKIMVIDMSGLNMACSVALSYNTLKFSCNC